MPIERPAPEEIVGKLRQVDVLAAQGKSIADAVRAIRTTEVTYYRWRKEYGGLKTDQVRKLKKLEAENARLRRAFSYDEEVGCVGVRPMIERLASRPVKPQGCFVGEPPLMDVITGHKAKHAVRATVRGKTYHSAQAPQGVNAVEYAADLIQLVRSIARDLADHGPRDVAYEIPYTTALTSVAHGGRALNIMLDLCELEMEVRAIGSQEPQAIITAIMARAQAEIAPQIRATDSACGVVFTEILS